MEISIILNSSFFSKEIFQRSDKIRIKGYPGEGWGRSSRRKGQYVESWKHERARYVGGREVSWLAACEWRRLGDPEPQNEVGPAQTDRPAWLLPGRREQCSRAVRS